MDSAEKGISIVAAFVRACDAWRPVPHAYRVTDFGLITDPTRVNDGAGPTSILVCWSGSLADEPFARDWATWGPRGWESLMAACAAVAPSLTERGARVLLRPHARHVLSDPYKCLRFIAERPDPCFGLALDAGAMLEHSMLADAEGHTERAFEMLGPVAAAVVLSGIARAADEESPPALTAPTEGLVNPRLLGELVRRHTDPATPLLLPGIGAPEAARQLAALGPPPLH